MSCLIVTDIFPPVAAVGTHRTVGLCRCLIERGWRVTVITARPRPATQTDEGLLKNVPPAVRVVRAAAPNPNAALSRLTRRLGRGSASGNAGRAVDQNVAETVKLTSAPPGGAANTPSRIGSAPNWLSWWLHCPDGMLPWYLPGLAAALREARRLRPDAVFSTAPMWTSHLIAGTLSVWLGVPWVADFRDPWVGSQWRSFPHAAHRHADEKLEQYVLGRARRITCAWDGIRRHLTGRYPAKAGRIETIVNGFDPAQIDAVPAIGPAGDVCTLIHTGTFYGPRSPEPLLAALAWLAETHPNDAALLRVELVGATSYNGTPLIDLARRHGVEKHITVRPPVPYREAVGRVKGAGVALLFGQSGSDELASVPAKAFDYIGLSKPVLAIGGGDDVCTLMERGGCQVWRAGAGDSEALASRLRDIAAWHRAGSITSGNPRARMQFSRVIMAERLADVISGCVCHAT